VGAIFAFLGFEKTGNSTAGAGLGAARLPKNI
jgi:hypothetical protein